MLLLFSSFPSSLLLCVDCVSALRSLRFLWRLEVVAKKIIFFFFFFFFFFVFCFFSSHYYFLTAMSLLLFSSSLCFDFVSALRSLRLWLVTTCCLHVSGFVEKKFPRHLFLLHLLFFLIALRFLTAMLFLFSFFSFFILLWLCFSRISSLGIWSAPPLPFRFARPHEQLENYCLLKFLVRRRRRRTKGFRLAVEC